MQVEARNKKQEKAMPGMKDKDKKYIANTFNRYNVEFSRGKGAVLYGKDGREYIDMVAGVAVNLLGYNDSSVNAAIKGQVGRYIHLSNWFYSDPQIKLAEKLVELNGWGKVFYVNSGAEAVEVAVKIARKWGMLCKGGANEIITMKNSFHGRTINALSATGQEKFHKYLNPKAPGYSHAEFNDIKSLEKLVTKKTAAVLIEPVQCEGGVHVAEKKYMKAIAELCRRKNILLAADEIQTGLGRTGKFFAYMHYGIKPDMVIAAKGLGGGLPLSCVIGGERAVSVYGPGDHGTTMGGNPVACAAGLAAVTKISSKKMAAEAAKKGGYIAGRLACLHSGRIREVRGLGMIVGVEFDSDIGAELTGRALEKGLIVNCPKPNVIRLVPPLVINKNQIDRAVEILKEVLEGIG